MAGDDRAQSGAAVVQPRRRGLSLQAQESMWFQVFILPWLVGFAVFVLGPMLASLFFSFTKYNAIQPPQWVGARNF